ncbi:hypothetical protein H4582DRAFT_2090733 [Lactarius indigo]|nr:hypothetical protein H4582DRAFT_2090733 [Lactarius indigo]
MGTYRRIHIEHQPTFSGFLIAAAIAIDIAFAIAAAIITVAIISTVTITISPTTAPGRDPQQYTPTSSDLEMPPDDMPRTPCPSPPFVLSAASASIAEAFFQPVKPLSITPLTYVSAPLSLTDPPGQFSYPQDADEDHASLCTAVGVGEGFPLSCIIAF